MVRRAAIIGVGVLSILAACVGDSATDNGGSGDGGTSPDGSSANDGGTSFDGSMNTSDGAQPPMDGGPLTAPRPIAPLSTATVTKHAPTFHWATLPQGIDGVRVEICSDRACTKIEQTFDAAGTSGKPTTALAKGVHFWRLRSKAGALVSTITSATWEFRVRATDAPVDTSWGSFADFDGDGFSEVVGFMQGPDATYYAGGTTLGGQQTLPQPTQGKNDGEDTWSLGSAGDVNGDGFADLILGGRCPGCAPTAGLDGGPMSAGHAYVYYGSETGIHMAGGPDLTLYSPDGTNPTYFGFEVAGIGDTNGDGYADIAVGAELYGTNPGRVYVYQGGPTGPTQVTSTLSGANSFHFGVSIAPIGDVDGDGLADVAIGTENQLVYIFLGNKTGLVAAGNPNTLTAAPEAFGTQWGRLAKVNGDVNGDGLCDLIVTSPNAPKDGGGDGPGSVWAYLGRTPLAITSWTHSVVLSGADGAGSGLGSAASVGDINGDGFDDVLVGEYSYNGTAGRAFLFLGKTAGLTTTPVTLDTSRGGGFGIVVNAGLDTNKDGFSEAFVGTTSGGYLRHYAGGSAGIDGGAFVDLTTGYARSIAP